MERRGATAAGQNGGVDLQAIDSLQIYLMKRGPRKTVRFVGCLVTSILYNRYLILSTVVCIGRGQGRASIGFWACLCNVAKMFTFYLWIVLILPLTLGEFVLL